MIKPEPISDNPIKTTCAYCGVGCGVIAEVDADGTVNISGDKEHPANYGRLCSKGSALGETVDMDHRLLHPLVNEQQVSWDEALQAVAEGFNQTIEKHGPESVAFYVSGQLLTEDYYVANKLMKGYIGTGNIDTNSRLCMSSAVAGHKRAFGHDSVALCYEDLEQAEAIVAIGSNLAWCHPVLFQRIEKVRAETGMKLIIVDPRRTASCDIADLHLPLKPGTDAVLFNGLLNYLVAADALDSNYIESYTSGFEEAQKTAASTVGDIDDVARQCDLAAEDVKTFFELFRQTPKLISFFSMGINQSSSGVDKVNAIINTHLASGKIGKPGMGAFSITGQPNAMGGREVGGLASTLAAHMDFSAEETDIVQRFWQSPTIATKPGLKAVDLFNNIHAGKIKAVWIMATNPSVSIPNADLVQDAMEKCELVVVSDCIHPTDTSRFADILLPAQGWAEKCGTVTNSERRISRQRAILKPAGDAKPDWWIVSEVAKRMGYEQGFNFASASEVFAEHAALSGFENNNSRDFDISYYSNISAAEFDALIPVQWPVTEEFPRGRQRLFEDGQFYTDDKRAHFIAITPRTPGAELSEEYPLVLNTGRVRDHWHTMTRTAKSPRLNRHINEPMAQCHPQTASQYGLHDQQLAQISSQWGQVIVKVEVTDRQRQGELFVPLHWNDQFSARARIDSVVNPFTDPISGQPEFKHTPVSVKPVVHDWHGFMLSRKEHDIKSLAYWSLIREPECWRYEFSDTSSHDREWFQSALHEGKGSWIFYQDEQTQQHRYALIENAQLQAIIFTATSPQQLPNREWLSEQFACEELTQLQKLKLIAGSPGSGMADPGPVVCSCFNVGKNIILQAIHDDGLKDVDEIGKALKAGTNCGSCKPELKCLVEECE